MATQFPKFPDLNDYADRLNKTLEQGETHLLRFLQTVFKTDALERVYWGLACAQEDLLQRTAGRGWLGCVELLLPHTMDNSDMEGAARVLSSSLEHPEVARRIALWMQKHFPERAAQEVYANHPELWPTVADLFPKDKQAAALEWAMAHENTYAFLPIILQQLENNLNGCKDSLSARNALGAFFSQMEWSLSNENLYTVAQGAVRGSYSKIFTVVEKHMEDQYTGKGDLSLEYAQRHFEALTQQRQTRSTWLDNKLGWAYLHNTPLAQRLLKEITKQASAGAIGGYNVTTFGAHSVNQWMVDVGASVWLETRNFGWLDRLAGHNPLLAQGIVLDLPLEELEAHKTELFKRPVFCKWVHLRWSLEKQHQDFLREVWENSPQQYKIQNPYLFKRGLAEKTREGKWLQERLKEHQAQNPTPGFFDQIVNSITNPPSFGKRKK